MAIRPSFSAPGTDNVLSSHPADYDWRRLSDQTAQMGYNAILASINAANRAGAGGPDADMAANRQRITDLTEGRAGELANDPRMNQAMDFFGSVLNGSKVPFSEETQRAQLNQQANGTAAANAAQLRALEEAITARGGSLQDPSFQAQRQEMMSNRQGQNLDALGRMLSQAGIANFNAQAQGANSLAGIRSGQNSQINQMNLAGAGYRAQDFREVPTGGSSTTTYSTSMLGQPQQPQAPAYSPQPTYQAPTPMAPRPAPTAAPAAPGTSTGTGTGWAARPGLSITTGTPYGPPSPAAPATTGPFAGVPLWTARLPTASPAPVGGASGSMRAIGPDFNAF